VNVKPEKEKNLPSVSRLLPNTGNRGAFPVSEGKNSGSIGPLNLICKTRGEADVS